MGKKQNQGDSTICSYKKYKHDIEILGEKNLWKRFIKQMVTKKSAVWQHYIRQNVIQSKKKSFKRNKDGIFHILKRYSCLGNYNIDPNGANKLPELHKARTGTRTKKNKIHNAKGRF